MLGAVGALAIGSGEALAKSVRQAAEVDDEGRAFAGMWQVTVVGAATYYYTYAVSAGAFVATGRTDNNWDGKGSSFGPTMGCYARQGSRTYHILERGWAFDPQGAAAGSFGFEGTYVLDQAGSGLTGSGTWTLYDLEGNAVFVEPLTVTGKKLKG